MEVLLQVANEITIRDDSNIGMLIPLVQQLDGQYANIVLFLYGIMDDRVSIINQAVLQGYAT